MKKLLIILSTLILLTLPAFAAQAEDAEAPVIIYTTASQLNIRSSPEKTDDNKIDCVPQNTQFTKLGEDDSWTKIEYNDGIAYIYTYYTAATPVENDNSPESDLTYSASYFKKMGVINWNGWRWTWYSERVLPDKGLHIPGRRTDDNGYVCDEDGYICLASVSLSEGTIVDTPFGKQGKVYDSGCPKGTLDVYTNW